MSHKPRPAVCHSKCPDRGGPRSRTPLERPAGGLLQIIFQNNHEMISADAVLRTEKRTLRMGGRECFRQGPESAPRLTFHNYSAL